MFSIESVLKENYVDIFVAASSMIINFTGRGNYPFYDSVPQQDKREPLLDHFCCPSVLLKNIFHNHLLGFESLEI